MLNARIEATSACPALAGVIGHRSSNLISKESKVTGIIADNHILFKLIFRIIISFVNPPLYAIY